jgi:hypothetical protein
MIPDGRPLTRRDKVLAWVTWTVVFLLMVPVWAPIIF